MFRVLFYIFSDNISSDGISLRKFLVINKQEKNAFNKKTHLVRSSVIGLP